MCEALLHNLKGAIFWWIGKSEWIEELLQNRFHDKVQPIDNSLDILAASTQNKYVQALCFLHFLPADADRAEIKIVLLSQEVDELPLPNKTTWQVILMTLISVK